MRSNFLFKIASTLIFINIFVSIQPAQSQIEAKKTTNIIENKQNLTQKISEAQVERILQDIINAANRKNSQDLIKFFSKNFRAEIIVEAQRQPIAIKQSREQYYADIQRGFKLTETYRASLTNLKIKISPDGKSAIANYKMIEEASAKGQKITTNSLSSTQFELIQGKIMVTNSKSVTQYAFL